MTFGQLTGRRNRFEAHFVETVLTFKIAPGLAVSHAPHGGHFALEIAPFPQRFHFVHEPFFQHLLEAHFNALMQRCARLRTGDDLENPVFQRLFFLFLLQFAHFPAGEFDDLEGAGYALRVIGMNSPGDFRVPGHQPCMQGRPSGLPGLLLYHLANHRTGRRQAGEAPGQRPEIEHGSTGQQGHPAPAGDFCHFLECICPELRHRVCFRRITDIDQRMRRPAQSAGIGLGRSHIHAAVDKG